MEPVGEQVPAAAGPAQRRDRPLEAALPPLGRPPRGVDAQLVGPADEVETTSVCRRALRCPNSLYQTSQLSFKDTVPFVT